MPRLCLFLLAALGVVGCQNRIPDDALALQPDTLERRLLESRRFAGGKEIEILSACSGVVQDMGFTIDESATPLGVMVASKNREAGDTGGRRARPPGGAGHHPRSQARTARRGRGATSPRSGGPGPGGTRGGRR